MELFSKIPGDDSVISRIQTLDETRFGYPDFRDFHLGQFVSANIECCERLDKMQDQIYLLIWLACKCDQNDKRSTFDLVEHYAHLIKHDVMHVDLAQFLDEVASTITEVIPSDQREKELNIFAYFLTNQAVDERLFAPILSVYSTEHKCISWLQERYVAGIIYVTAIKDLRTYFITTDRLFKKIVRGLHDEHLSEEDWLIMLRSVEQLIPEDTKIGSWEPLQRFKKSVFQPHHVDDRILFVQLCTLFREDWMKIWTLMGWTNNRRTKRELITFKTVSKVRPKYNTSTQLFCCL